MREPGDQHRLAAEALGVLGVGEEPRVQALHGDRAPEHRVGGAPDRGHAPAADQMVEPVALAEERARQRPWPPAGRHPPRIPGPRAPHASGPVARGIDWPRGGAADGPDRGGRRVDLRRDRLRPRARGLPHAARRRRGPGPAPVPPAAAGPGHPRPDAAGDGRLAGHRGAPPGGSARAGDRLQRAHQRVRPRPRPGDGRRRLRHEALLHEGAARPGQRAPSQGRVAPPARRRRRRSRSRAS